MDFPVVCYKLTADLRKKKKNIQAYSVTRGSLTELPTGGRDSRRRVERGRNVPEKWHFFSPPNVFVLGFYHTSPGQAAQYRRWLICSRRALR